MFWGAYKTANGEIYTNTLSFKMKVTDWFKMGRKEVNDANERWSEMILVINNAEDIDIELKNL